MGKPLWIAVTIENSKTIDPFYPDLGTQQRDLSDRCNAATFAPQMKAVRELSQWFERQHRKLPWRQHYPAYGVWISEIMLQQTQVATVIPYYERFLSRFPDVKSLANAETEEVMKLWAGLGYYSRARNLQKGAQYLVENHQSQLPKERSALLKVPGIGPYTAGAILSIAYNLPEAIVDGNVQRVFARYYGIRTQIKDPQLQKKFWELAERWVCQSEKPRSLNQGLMELGATLCRKGNPSCEVCPIASGCVAKKEGLQAQLPTPAPRRKNVDLTWITLLLEKGDQVWLRQNPPGEWWADLWDFPRSPVEGDLEGTLKALQKKYPGNWEELDHRNHQVTHHRLRVIPYRCQFSGSKTALKEGKWVRYNDLQNKPLSSLAKKVLGSRRSLGTC